MACLILIQYYQLTLNILPIILPSGPACGRQGLGGRLIYTITELCKRLHYQLRMF